MIRTTSFLPNALAVTSLSVAALIPQGCQKPTPQVDYILPTSPSTAPAGGGLFAPNQVARAARWYSLPQSALETSREVDADQIVVGTESVEWLSRDLEIAGLPLTGFGVVQNDIEFNRQVDWSDTQTVSCSESQSVNAGGETVPVTANCSTSATFSGSESVYAQKRIIDVEFRFRDITGKGIGEPCILRVTRNGRWADDIFEISPPSNWNFIISSGGYVDTYTCQTVPLNAVINGIADFLNAAAG